MRCFLFIAFFVFLCKICFAQELEVVEPLHSTIFEIVGAQDKKYDANGVPCAVVKVQLPVAGVTFEGPVIESQYHINEYWVWFSSGTNGTKKFRIKCPGAQMLEVDVTKTIPEGLQPNLKYAIKLNLPQVPLAMQEADEQLSPAEMFKKAEMEYNAGNYEKAFALFSKISDDAEARNYLGIMYANGNGVAQDSAKALMWLKKSANQGNANAQFNLGYMYVNGSGVEQDYKEGVKWYRKSADQGFVEAQFNLGVIYAYGIGGEPDAIKAVSWFRKAAEQGYAPAQCILGIMYEEGESIEEDYEEAVKWYRKAADQGHAMAQCHLGIMYEAGDGVEKDYAEAVKWYLKSAEQGYADGQYCLANMYEYGYGVAENYAEALKWYRKAAAQGFTDAQEKLKELEESY